MVVFGGCRAKLPAPRRQRRRAPPAIVNPARSNTSNPVAGHPPTGIGTVSAVAETTSADVAMSFSGFGSFAALVEPTIVMVPLAGTTKVATHVIDADGASVATGETGEHINCVPPGRPDPVHVATSAVPAPTFVHAMTICTMVPGEAFAGRPLTDADMSDGAAAMVTTVFAKLFSRFASFAAPVLAATLATVGDVGLPATVQVIVCPAGTETPATQAVAAGPSTHPVTLKPGGSPVIEHVAAGAAAAHRTRWCT